ADQAGGRGPEARVPAPAPLRDAVADPRLPPLARREPHARRRRRRGQGAARAAVAARGSRLASRRSARSSAEPADAPLRVLPAQRQAGPRAARRGGALSSGQRRGARAPELDGRLPRAAGLRIGSDRVIDCVRALEIAGAQRRDDWYWTMSAVLLSRQEQRPIFDQAFQIFWRDPKLTEAMMQMLLPQAYGRAARPEQPQSQRLTDALFSQQREARDKAAERLDTDARP